MLAATGLDTRPKRKPTRSSLLDAIRRMQVLQIDTIHVVARSPYLVLFSRLGAYDPTWLDDHLEAGNLFEYWAHEACFIPIEDYPLFRGRMLDRSWRRIAGWHEWAARNRVQTKAVLDHVRANGGVRSIELGDVRRSGKSGGWWERKPEKQALEMLFDTGELMIARRHNFQRVYDLRERRLPDWDDAHLPDALSVEEQLMLKAVRALGIANSRWARDYYRRKHAAAITTLEWLAEAGQLIRATVDGWAGEFYIHPDNAALARRAMRGAIKPDLVTLLSPFDPLVWDRARALEAFGFDYRIECYTPEAKRVYGYFSLPILRRGEIVGRLDAKAHRSEGVFEIRSLHYEKGVDIDEALIADVRAAVHECARWHDTPAVRCAKQVPNARTLSS